MNVILVIHLNLNRICFPYDVIQQCLSLPLSNLLKNKTIFMLDGNQERVPIVICHTVAFAVMLNLNDDCLQLADFVIYKKRPEEGIILAAFALVANEDR